MTMKNKQSSHPMKLLLKMECTFPQTLLLIEEPPREAPPSAVCGQRVHIDRDSLRLRGHKVLIPRFAQLLDAT